MGLAERFAGLPLPEPHEAVPHECVQIQVFVNTVTLSFSFDRDHSYTLSSNFLKYGYLRLLKIHTK